MNAGDIVILDKGYNCSSEVELINLGIVKNDKLIKDFSTIRENKRGQWNVANFRLSPKDETLLQGDNKAREIQA